MSLQGIDITDENDPILETKTKSPFTNASWVGIKNVYEPITLVYVNNNHLRLLLLINSYYLIQ